MPAGGKNSTFHKIVDKTDFTQYPFSPSVIIVEKRITFNKEKLEEAQVELKKEGILIYWDESENDPHYTRKYTRIELYRRYPQDTPFKDKMEDMQAIMNKYGL